MAEFLQVTTTVESKDEAEEIGRTVVERRLAACVQIMGPITSVYWWENRVEQAEEWLCLMKTRAELYPELERAVREIHPYEVPELLATPVEAGSADYLSWLQREVKAY